MIVEWKVKGIYKADAQKVAEEIGKGRITPQEVLEKARDENSELHKCFEWDDSIAAEKYRLQQARAIIINLEYKSEDESKEPTRAYQLTTVTNTYQPAEHFRVQHDEYQALLKRAKMELEAFKRRYHNLTELEAIFEAMEAL
jgi:hypothetical protein